MLTLTPLEVAELKRACGDIHHEYEWDQAVIDDLIERGYIVTWEVGYLSPVGLRIKQEELGKLLADLAREYYK